jgi:tRNA modification GTPase
MMYAENTICAIATPPGHGAISIIRISGPDTFLICDSIVKRKKISAKETHTIHLCEITDNGNIIDEVIIAVFRAPHSYTGEDVAEISCHGSSYIQQRIMEILIKHGAKLAKPGEFTLRAFLNGKMDLSQAEAVADLIASESDTAHKMALYQMRGGFSTELKKLRERLLHFISLLELELDFSEEDVEFANREDLIKLISEIHQVLGNLTNSFSLGNVIKTGVPVAIVGKPNVGKSTLLNTLLQEEKAIVSEIAGTTRDSIEDCINIKGIRFRFIDTAGIRQTTDTIESMGVKRTFKKIGEARTVLLLVDANNSVNDIKKQIGELNLSKEQNLIVVFNKIDLYDRNEISRNIGGEKTFDPYPVIMLSAKLHSNTDKLHEMLLNTVLSDSQQIGSTVISNIRHYEALLNAYYAALRASSGLDNKEQTVLIAHDIREILHYLGQITGEITTDEILGNIFKNFCIGK